MKESELIRRLKEGETQRLQNNQMIGSLMSEVNKTQELVAGMVKVIRRLPDYDEIINEVAAEYQASLKDQENETNTDKLDLGDD